jgi:hypothetical protein
VKPDRVRESFLRVARRRPSTADDPSETDAERDRGRQGRRRGHTREGYRGCRPLIYSACTYTL